jgi:hypothetical protein
MRSSRNIESNPYIRFGSTELELDDGDLGFFHARRATCRDDNVLIENDAVHELGVFYRPPNFLDYPNVSQIYIGGSGGDKAGDSSHRNGSEG